VPVLPSTAALAGVPAFSEEDAVAGRLSAALVVPQAAAAACGLETVAQVPRTSRTAASTAGFRAG
jgi:hypothetical protein